MSATQTTVLERPTSMEQELNTVWGRIGGDILTAVSECDGRTSIPQDEVVDVVMDHMRNGHGVSQATLDYLDSLGFEELQREIGSCFRFETYGW